MDLRPMELKDTAAMMLSEDYKERFRAEYGQLRLRYQKLKSMLDRWDQGMMEFEPTCPEAFTICRFGQWKITLQFWKREQ